MISWKKLGALTAGDVVLLAIGYLIFVHILANQHSTIADNFPCIVASSVLIVIGTIALMLGVIAILLKTLD